VLLAAAGVATAAIGRTVGCTTGTASKWRVRYAAARLTEAERARLEGLARSTKTEHRP
jgi:hypothetical protein